MPIDLSREKELRPWLVKTLEPICDADPNTLAEYVIALLKAESDSGLSEAELRPVLKDQLNEFVEDIDTFLGALLLALRTKSYVTDGSRGSPPPTRPSRLAPPPHAISSGSPNIISNQPGSRPPSRKRRFETSGQAVEAETRPHTRQRMDIDDHGPPRHMPDPRSIPDLWNQTNSNGTPAPISSDANGFNGRRSGGGTGPKICFDYFNKGHCRRGDQCKYSHGDNPILASNLPFFPNGMMLNGGFPMMQTPYGMHPLMGQNLGHFGPFTPQFGASDERDAVMVDVTPNRGPNPLQNHNSRESDSTMSNAEASSSSLPMIPGGADRPQGYIPPIGPTSSDGGHRTQNGASSDRMRNPGISRHEGTLTIVVDKIPQQHANETAVTEWFQRFGVITKVVLDRRTKKALVTFTDKKEASAAIRSPDAPWGNKFAKVFWHNPIFSGASGAKALAADSAPLEPFPSKSASTSLVLGANGIARSAINPSEPPSTSPTRRTMQELILEQKSLLDEAKDASPERKKEIISKLRDLQKEISTSTATPAADAPASSVSPKPSSVVPFGDTRVTSGTEGARGAGYEALKARLESLRAEATSLGIDPLDPDGEASAPAHFTNRGFAPRGRGRARSRGRGGVSASRGRGIGRTNMKLDLRPRKLIVKLGMDESAKVGMVKQWFQDAGEVEETNLTPNGDIVISFRSRVGAEQALAKGTDIPGVGVVHLAWHVDTGAPAKGPATGLNAGGNPENQDLALASELNVSGQVNAGDDGPAENYEEAEDPDAMTAW